MCYNMSEPWKDVKWKKLDTKGNVCEWSYSYEMSRVGTFSNSENRLVLASGWA